MARMTWLLALGALLVLGCDGAADDDDATVDDDDATADDDDAVDDDDTGDDDDSADDDDATGVDADGDGFTEDEDCNDANATVYPGAEQLCDGIYDNDCDGYIDANETDSDGDGYTECDGDCDDTSAEAHPGLIEVIDGIDNDCDGDVDEDDCGNIPAGPLPFNVLSGYPSGEDFAFDDAGYMIADSNGGLFKTDYAGSSSLWSPGNNTFIAGLRALPTGDLVYSDVTAGNLVLVDGSTGARTTVLSGLSYGNGIEVDWDGYVYVAEQSGSRVRRIDPYTGDNTTLVSGLNNPNGLSFDPTYSILYIGSFGGGTIWAQEVNPDGSAGALSTLATNVGTGSLDGMGVDACGNVYVCDYGQIKVLRIPPDGSSVEVAVDLHAVSYWIPNMQWGSGVGGWDEQTLYVIDIGNDIYEIPLGVGSKPRQYP